MTIYLRGAALACTSECISGEDASVERTSRARLTTSAPLAQLARDVTQIYCGREGIASFLLGEQFMQ